MPLKPDNSNKVRSENIKELHKANPSRPIKQDVAIAFAESRKSKSHKKTKKAY